MKDETAIIDQRPTTNDPIHVALAVYDPSGTYSQHAGVTITSIFENTKSKVIVHILHDDTLTEDNRRKFIRTAEKYNQTIEFVDVTVYTKSLSQKIKKLTTHFTVGTLYRLFIPEIFSSLSRIIYLDCDIIVNLDINELWDIDLGNNCFAGCLDEYIQKLSMFSYIYVMCLLGGCKPSLYVNAGVLVMNLNHIRTFANVSEIFKNWIEYHIHSAIFTDQDFVNSLFIDSIKRIDRRFNRQLWDYSDDLSNAIIHTNKRKSWKNFPTMYPDCLYWKMYLRSAWGENITTEGLVDVLSRIKDGTVNSALLHKSPLKCVRRIIRAIWNKITFSNTRRIIKMLLKDIFHKMKYRITAHTHRYSQKLSEH